MQDKLLRKKILKKERYKFLLLLEKRLDLPMVLLAIAWLAFLILKLFSDHNVFSTLFFLVWGILTVDFLIRFWVAPNRLFFLKKNSLLAFSVLLPVFRIVGMILLHRDKKKAINSANSLSKKDSRNKMI